MRIFRREITISDTYVSRGCHIEYIVQLCYTRSIGVRTELNTQRVLLVECIAEHCVILYAVILFIDKARYVGAIFELAIAREIFV